MFEKLKSLFNSPLEATPATIIILLICMAVAIVGTIFLIKLLKGEFRYGASM